MWRALRRLLLRRAQHGRRQQREHLRGRRAGRQAGSAIPLQGPRPGADAIVRWRQFIESCEIWSMTEIQRRNGRMRVTFNWTAMRFLAWILYPLRRNRIAVLGARSAPKQT